MRSIVMKEVANRRSFKLGSSIPHRARVTDLLCALASPTCKWLYINALARFTVRGVVLNRLRINQGRNALVTTGMAALEERNSTDLSRSPCLCRRLESENLGGCLCAR
jgi:hypothetical protein